MELKLDKIADKKDALKANKPRGYLAQLKELSEEEREIREKLAEAEQTFKDSKHEIKYKLENKDDALNTAKTNYSNPKIAYSLCKYCKKDPKVILSKALIEKFNAWVDFESIDENYWKDYPNVDE